MGPLGMGVQIRMIMDHESNDACTGRMKRVWVAEECVDGMHPFVGPHSRRVFSADIDLTESGKEYRVSLSLIRQRNACAWSIGTVSEMRNTIMWLFTSCSGEVMDKLF